MAEDGRHSIRIPGSILDELKVRSNVDDERFSHFHNDKKRKFEGHKVGRKERRKQERIAKKQKKHGGPVATQLNNNKTFGDSKFKSNVQAPSIAQKSSGKNNKNNNGQKKSKNNDLPFSSDDELDSDDFDNIDDELDSDEREQLRELENYEDDESNSDEQSDFSENESESEEEFDDGEKELTVEETMAALKALKNKKSKDTASKSKIDEDGSETDGSDYIDNEQDDLSDNDFDEEIDENEDQEMTVDETMAALKALKDKKANKKAVHFAEDTKDPSSFGEESSESDYIDSEQDDLNSEDFDSAEENDEESATEMTVEETMAALKALKSKKQQTEETAEPPKEKKIKHRKKAVVDEDYAKPVLTPQERAMLEKDEMDMQYYAKKLGLKGKNKKIKARDEYDAIGGLLDGLDYFENYGDDDEDYGDFAIANKNKVESDESEESSEEDGASSEDSEEDGEDEEEVDEDNIVTPFSSDDDIDSDDFDEFDEGDLNEEEWRQLRELEGYGSDDNEEYSESSDEEASKKKKKKSKKENPYVAPSSNEPEENEGGAYIPPSLRKQQALSVEDSKTSELRKKVKMALNKLSESNVSNIVATLSDLYNSYPRQLVSDVFAEQTIELVSLNNKVLDSFIMNYSAVTFSLWKLKGVEMGATFVQKVVETFIKEYNKELSAFQDAQDSNDDDDDDDERAPILSTKKASNLITLLSYCYNFGMLSCKLIYDIIDLLVSTPNEYTTEILLRVISVSGPMIRGDDPLALKSSLTNLLNNVKKLKKQSSRMKFLLDTVSDLKNNRLKTSMLAPSHVGLKKSIVSSLKLSGHGDPIQVSLSDIQNIETTGKWWLVGASWKGKGGSAFDNADHADSTVADMDIVDMEIDDDFLEDIPDWGKIAKEQRMNTDLRRSIFVSIMSAQDFMDAFTKLEKLNLKNKQSLEIPRVILHCATMDGNGFNPYYSVLSSKLSEYNHNVVKGLQFQFWNVIKRFETEKGSYGSDMDMEDEDDEETQQQVYGFEETTRLKRISAQAQFFGYMIADGTLKFDIFKHVPLIGGLNADGMFFIELVLYQILIMVAKKSEVKKGKNNYEYQDGLLRQTFIRGIKLENQSMILKSLQWFNFKKFKPVKLIQHEKGSKEYEKEERRVTWAQKKLDEIIKDALENLD